MPPATLQAPNRFQLSLFRFSFLFTGLFIITLPFPQPYFPNTGGWLSGITEPLVRFVGDRLPGLQFPYVHQLISDSTGLYIHTGILFTISLAGTAAWSLISRRTDEPLLKSAFIILISYYLAYHMLIYGFNKVFKWQFFLPEPNTLYTTVGDMHRDLLYWSAMGSSHAYNVFLGTAELLAGLLLLFRRTRLAGALAAFVLLLNIVVVNFSFNISVKLLSLFLFLLSILLLGYYRRFLLRLFQYPEKIPGKQLYRDIGIRGKMKYGLKSVIIIWLLAGTLAPYLASGNLNDDRASRPVFHGAYEVSSFVHNGDTLPPLLTDPYRWRRVFVHRRDYLVIQGMDGTMQDFQFVADTVSHTWRIREEGSDWSAELAYREPAPGLIQIRARLGGDSVYALLTRLETEKLNLFRNEFSWTMD